MPASCASAGVGYWHPTHAHLVPEDPLERRPVRALDRGVSVGVDAGGVPRVLRRVDHDERVAGLEGVHLDRGRDREPLERRRTEPGARREVGVEGDAQQRVRVELGDAADDLLEQRPAGRCADDEYLPAGLNADARVDEELCELTISRVCHGAVI